MSVFELLNLIFIQHYCPEVQDYSKDSQLLVMIIIEKLYVAIVFIE